MFYKALLLSFFMASGVCYYSYDLDATPSKKAEDAGKTVKKGWKDNVEGPVGGFFKGLK